MARAAATTVAMARAANAARVWASGWINGCPRSACQVTRATGPGYPAAATATSRARTASGRRRGEVAGQEPEQHHEQRQSLQCVHADEMRDAQVAADRAPAGDRHVRPAVGNTDAVCACELLNRRFALCRGRRDHQRAEGDADHRDHRPEPQCPTDGCIGDRDVEEQHGEHERVDPDRRDTAAHDQVQHVIERGRHVEVAGRGSLREQDRVLDGHQGDDDVRHPLAKIEPITRDRGWQLKAGNVVDEALLGALSAFAELERRDLGTSPTMPNWPVAWRRSI
jgi:hypothetical protein